MVPPIVQELDIMATLKAETHELHSAVERVVPIFHHALSLSGYIRMLQAFLGFIEPAERKLAQIMGWERAGLHLHERTRAHLLHKDLRALGADSAVGQSQALPKLETLDEGLGCLYVFEGSTLGGQFICAEVKRRLGIDQFSGASFFYSRGDETAAQWSQFGAALREYAPDPQAHPGIVHSAVQTFTLFQGWMQSALHSGEENQ